MRLLILGQYYIFTKPREIIMIPKKIIYLGCGSHDTLDAISGDYQKSAYPSS